MEQEEKGHSRLMMKEIKILITINSIVFNPEQKQLHLITRVAIMIALNNQDNKLQSTRITRVCQRPKEGFTCEKYEMKSMSD